MTTFRCKDLGLACDFEAEASGENEIMKRIEGHVMTVHQMDLRRREDRAQVREVLSKEETPKPS